MSSYNDLPALVVLVLVLLVLPLWFLLSSDDQIKACEAKGGQLVRTMSGSVCAKLEVLK
jgi:hypothetical protein